MVFGQQDIFRLYIPVDYLVLFVDGMNGFEDMDYVVFIERFPDNSVEFGLVPKLSSFGVLHL